MDSKTANHANLVVQSPDWHKVKGDRRVINVALEKLMQSWANLNGFGAMTKILEQA